MLVEGLGSDIETDHTDDHRVDAARSQASLGEFDEGCADAMAPGIRIDCEESKLAFTRNGKLSVMKVNVDENREFAQKFEIKGLPTMLLFKDGGEIDRLIGFMPKEKIIEKVSAKL